MHRSTSERSGDSRRRHQDSQALVRNQLTGRVGPAPGLLEDRRRRSDRRTHSVRSFLVGSLRPRRRVGRRQGDDDRVFLDWHEPRILYLALGILLMSCADALLTLNILNDGGRELNGVMEWLISSRPSWFAGVKIGITAFSVTLLVIGVNRHFLGRIRVIRLMELFCAGYFVLMLWELYLLRGTIPAILVNG